MECNHHSPSLRAYYTFMAIYSSLSRNQDNLEIMCSRETACSTRNVGRGRCDFPGGDAQSQFQSMQRLLSFPPETKLYTGHDDPPAPTNQHPSRNPLPYSTVAEEREK